MQTPSSTKYDIFVWSPSQFIYSEVKEDELTSSTNLSEVASFPSVTLIRKQFAGRYAISSEEFTRELVSLAVSL